MKNKEEDYSDESTLDKEIGRYARQILIEEWDQSKLTTAKIFIAGMGALGCSVALNLALMGVKNIIICDYDTVEISNLSRQILFFEKDIDRYKVEAAKENLERWNPEINITTYNMKLQKVRKEIYENVDIIIDGLDTFGARRFLNSIAIDLKKPLIHGGLFGWMGNVQYVIPGETACLECQPLIPRKRLQKPCTPLGKMRKKEREKKGETIDKESEEKIPSLLTTNSIIAGIQSQLALKWILGLQLPDENYIFYDGLSESFTRMKLNKNESCIVCSEKYRSNGVNFSISEQDTIRDIKDRLVLTWDLDEPFNLMYKGKILEDETKIESLKMENRDAFFVWNKNVTHPMKFYVIFSDELEPTKIVIDKIPKRFEIELEWGTITKTKQKIIKEAEKLNQKVKFYKTEKLKNGNYLVRYDKIQEIE